MTANLIRFTARTTQYISQKQLRHIPVTAIQLSARAAAIVGMPLYLKTLLILPMLVQLYACAQPGYFNDPDPVFPGSITQPPLPIVRATETQPTPAQRETSEFNQAFAQLKAAKYDAAIAAFKQFIQHYPQSERRAETHYWIGEAHYLAKDYPQALEQFSHIIIYFADSEFARQAMLKSADTYRAMQDIPQAKLFYQRVIKNHPHTSYAVKATEQLRQLR